MKAISKGAEFNQAIKYEISKLNALDWADCPVWSKEITGPVLELDFERSQILNLLSQFISLMKSYNQYKWIPILSIFFSTRIVRKWTKSKNLGNQCKQHDLSAPIRDNHQLLHSQTTYSKPHRQRKARPEHRGNYKFII